MNKHLRDRGSDVTHCGRLVEEVPSIPSDTRYDRREICRVCLRGSEGIEATDKTIAKLIEYHRRMTICSQNSHSSPSVTTNRHKRCVAK
jgi:hypothetical protein